MIGCAQKYLLHAQALFSTFGERYNETGQMFALFSSADPSLGIEFLRFREQSGIHMNKVI